MCDNTNDYWYDQSGKDSVTKPPVESETMALQADSITGGSNGTNLARGNVLGYKNNQTISSDWLSYDQPASRMVAGDNLVLTRQYDTISGSYADYFFDTSSGVFKKATIYQKTSTSTATGNVIEMQDAKHYTIDQGTYTTCSVNDPDWILKASNLNFDYQNFSGTARNTTMYFESVPIFYTPYISFPLGERKSGFLTPELNTVTNRSPVTGKNMTNTGIGIPYYWNIAPNYDATITPKYWTQGGFMATEEFRYLQPSGRGSFYSEQLFHDTHLDAPNTPADKQINGKFRGYISAIDRREFIKGLQTGFNYNAVTDQQYFNDFGNFYAVTDNVNLNQSIYAKYKESTFSSGIKIQHFQTLQPLGYTSTIPIYGMWPQIDANLAPTDIGDTGIKSNLTSQYTFFDSKQLQSGGRTYIYPSLTYPMKASWGYSTPKVGLNYTNYALQNALDIANPANAAVINRTLPIVSVDNGLYFDKPLELKQGNYTQTLEPRLYYLYIPQNNQSHIPLFDTSTATYNINQLFSENRFAGFDRINQANDITIGATTRSINDSNGNEFMNLGIGYRYSIVQENPFNYGNYQDYSQLYQPTPNIITEINNNWHKAFSTNAYFQYDSNYNTIDAYSAGFKYNPDVYKIFNFKFRYQYKTPLLFYNIQPGQVFNATYENQYAIDASGQWPIYKDKIFAIGKTSYDFTAKQWLNFISGVEYNSGCWAFSASYQQYLINLNQYTGTTFFQLRFKGLGGAGTGSPLNSFKNNVPGYVPVTNY